MLMLDSNRTAVVNNKAYLTIDFKQYYRVITVLLDFCPMAVVFLRNQINEFRPKILSMEISKDHWNTLKVLDKTNAFFLRY